MVRFEKDQVCICIPTTVPVETYLMTLEALHKLFAIATQTKGDDEVVMDAVNVLSSNLCQNMSQLEPQMLRHMERGIALSLQADEVAQAA